VIEGLRVLPWLQETRRERPDVPLFNCDSCIKSTPVPLRREMGCGYLAGSTPPMWGGPNGKLELETCPGYTTELPDVVDVARLYSWAEKGGLQRHRLTRPIIDGIDILRSAVADVEVYSVEKAKEKR
jgi:hypothetical protein